MLFKINKQYARGSDLPVAEFNDLNDAKLFVKAKLADDARLKVAVKYRLVEGMDVLEEFEPGGSVAADSSGGSGSSSGTQQRSGAPSPFNTAPRPAGMPQGWGSKADTEDDKKK